LYENVKEFKRKKESLSVLLEKMPHNPALTLTRLSPRAKQRAFEQVSLNKSVL
jgi:hypothetical protein